jgi:hypothetical protein
MDPGCVKAAVPAYAARTPLPLRGGQNLFAVDAGVTDACKLPRDVMAGPEVPAFCGPSPARAEAMAAQLNKQFDSETHERPMLVC